MTDKLTYIPNDDAQINPFVDLNYWFKHLDTQLAKPTNQNSIFKIQVPKVVKLTNTKPWGLVQ